MTRLDGLIQQYLQLRTDLEAAYASNEWNSVRVDDITDRLVPIEFALASLGYRRAPSGLGGESSSRQA